MCDWMIILYIYANQEVSLCGNMAIQVELYICAFFTRINQIQSQYRFGRENGTTQQWLVVDSITIVFQSAGCQVNASHNVSVDRENVTKKCDLYGLYVDSMSVINQFIIAHTKSVICENMPMCCDCAS